jgi:GTPase SAR1 family protein
MIILLLGNKDDLKAEREVTTEEGQEFANKHNLIFFETSAKTGHNIEEAFVQSAAVVNENIKNG